MSACVAKASCREISLWRDRDHLSVSRGVVGGEGDGGGRLELRALAVAQPEQIRVFAVQGPQRCNTPGPARPGVGVTPPKRDRNCLRSVRDPLPHTSFVLLNCGILVNGDCTKQAPWTGGHAILLASRWLQAFLGGVYVLLVGRASDPAFAAQVARTAQRGG